jgi:RNA polymerase sigma factor (TIGR02999 family)
VTDPSITELLVAHGRGVETAFDRLLPLVYADLKRLARSQRRRMPAGGTLDTTGLVHEAYLKLVDQSKVNWQDRGHFLAVSAMAMRQILVDHARSKGRQKRGGDARHTSLDDRVAAVERDAALTLDLDRALGKLGALDPRLVRVVECRYFAGLTEQETAEAIGVSLRTAQREWLRARAWLREELGK